MLGLTPSPPSVACDAPYRRRKDSPGKTAPALSPTEPSGVGSSSDGGEPLSIATPSRETSGDPSGDSDNSRQRSRAHTRSKSAKILSRTSLGSGDPRKGAGFKGDGSTCDDDDDDDDDDYSDTDTDEDLLRDDSLRSAESLSGVAATAATAAAPSLSSAGSIQGGGKSSDDGGEKRVLWVLKSGEEAKLEGMDLRRPLFVKVGFAAAGEGSAGKIR